MKTLTLRRPDDWHLHLRDGAVLEGVIGDTSRHFARAIIMPNLVPPVVTTADARAYRERIMTALPKGDRFEPLMTLYLTEHTDPNDLEEGKKSGLITAVKLYPAGCDDQFPRWRARFRQGDAGAGTHGKDRSAALRPW